VRGIGRSVPATLVALVGLAAWAGVACRSADDSDTGARLAALEERVAALEESRPAARRAGAARAPAEVAELRLEGAPSRGPEAAPVTVVEFTDFECPYCLRAQPSIERLRAEYPDSVRVVFKHFPLSFHKRAINAHRAALAAGEQGKFWEMHDLIFQNPRALDAGTMKQHARALGLDEARFEQSFASSRLAERIDRDVAEGRAAGVRGTPAFFINGRLLSGAQPFDRFKALVDEELGKRAS
jgi:protein-disulfide isomerase